MDIKQTLRRYNKMASIREKPQGQVQEPPQITPPIAETAQVEASRTIVPTVKDAVSRAIIVKANQQVAVMLASTLKSCLKLAKTSYGSVARWPQAFNALKRIAGGI